VIRYDLVCDTGHAFDAWFGSAAAFDRQSAAGHIACPDCGTTAVTKALMAPAVSTREAARAAALARLREEVETKSDYVGLRFAAEARAIHEGRAPERAIYGEARPDEARALIEDGVPVAPLPFIPKARAN
jgi:hypothetical protein